MMEQNIIKGGRGANVGFGRQRDMYYSKWNQINHNSKNFRRGARLFCGLPVVLQPVLPLVAGLFLNVLYIRNDLAVFS